MEHETRLIKLILLDNHHRMMSSTTRNTCLATLILLKFDDLSKRKVVLMENGEVSLVKVDFTNLSESDNLIINETVKCKNKNLDKIIFKILHEDKFIKNYLIAVAEECKVNYEVNTFAIINYKKYEIDDKQVIDEFKNLINCFEDNVNVYDYMILLCLKYSEHKKKWFDKETIIKLKEITKKYEQHDKWFSYVTKIIKNSRDEDLAALTVFLAGGIGQ